LLDKERLVSGRDGVEVESGGVGSLSGCGQSLELDDPDASLIALPDGKATDPADLGGESPCFAHLLEDLPDSR
jgi:hypothetical protein